MWKMFDVTFECDECGGTLGPPPKFLIPPPPRPPSMGEFSFSGGNCNEEELALKAQQAWDNDMCETLPILDASLYSSQSLQTSAMIAVFSLLLLLVVLISSLFVWKNKRKVQNFLPCKTPTRGPHINGGLPLGGGHAVTYEDPDAHMGHHRPLVMRHHHHHHLHNVEMLHGKSIHYPSGYPMTRSPPFLVSSSPGPDPYRSNDNVYEELGPGRDSDGESEPPLHSDDDFAEDELSLPGERSFNKSHTSDATSTLPAAVSTIYHERATAAATVACASASNANAPERNSVLSSSSSTHDASTATAASTNSSHNNNTNNNNNTNTSSSGGLASGSTSTTTTRSGPSGLLSGMLRHTTGRSKFHTANGSRAKSSTSTTLTRTPEAGDIAPIQQLYDNRSNLMSLAYVPQQQSQHHPHSNAHPQHAAYLHHSLHHVNHNNNNNQSNTRTPAPQFYNTLENEVERRNRINAQLSNAHMPPAVATIFRERIQYPGSGRCPQPYYTSNGSNGLLANTMRARTNPRSAMDRRHRIAVPADPIEPAYGYAEPMYRENYHYDSCTTPTPPQQQQQQTLAYPAYIVPAYSSSGVGLTYRAPASTTYQNSTQLYTRGDSSFGSDSGYSHHTPASSIGRHDYDVVVQPAPPPLPPTLGQQKHTSRLSAALNFGWNRRKASHNENAHTTPTTPPTAFQHVQQSKAMTTTHSGVVSEAVVVPETGSPSNNNNTNNNNNNSGSSTVTTTLEHSSSSPTSNGSTATHNNNAAAQTLA